MKRVPDRKKLRRIYREKRARMFGGLFYFVFSVGVLLWFAGSLLRLAGSVSLVIWLGLGVCFLALGYMGWRYFRSTAKELKELPYVPPVTADTLPPEEVLVRGAQAPATPNEALLRPSAATPETKAEELLRSAEE